MPAIDLDKAYEEFSRLKTENIERNNEYYLLRQAVEGNFRWPRDWPRHIPKLSHNLCKPITERFVTYLMGKGFSYNVERPNDLEHRQAAERAEKILKRLLELAKADLQFDMGAKMGSQVGRTIFKVYKKGKSGNEHACFTFCQPDYFYGIPAGDGALGDYAVVYYSYPIDIATAKATYGDRDFKVEADHNNSQHYDRLPEALKDSYSRQRKVPVLEVWTANAYALVVGGVTIYNGDNPYKWANTGEGFIPFIVIENIRNAGTAKGEADIEQARELNEQYNYVLSRKTHVVSRWLNPTVVWEGAPTNYSDLFLATQSGGGVLPTRLGSRLSFLSYDKPFASVSELEVTLRSAILESCGMSELALQGTVQQSVATGTALAAQFQPILSTVEKKRREWDWGLKALFSMLLEVQEQIGDSGVLGEAVVNQQVQSREVETGELVRLSGKDIEGLRTVTIAWPGVLPKDDTDQARLEMEKVQTGIQSIYTTLEKLGVEYPDDEIARIRMENQDPSLKGQEVAEQIRARTPLLKAQMEAQGQGMPGPEGMDPEDFMEPSEENALAAGDIGARLRALNARQQPEFDEEGDLPTIRTSAYEEPAA